jgi:hypothetical protein
VNIEAIDAIDRARAFKGRNSSVDALEWVSGTEFEIRVVGEILRNASDHLYLQVDAEWAAGQTMASEGFAAVDLLDDLRAEMGVL